MLIGSGKWSKKTAHHATVSTILRNISLKSLLISCICIPILSAKEDRETNLLIRSFNSKRKNKVIGVRILIMTSSVIVHVMANPIDMTTSSELLGGESIVDRSSVRCSFGYFLCLSHAVVTAVM